MKTTSRQLLILVDYYHFRSGNPFLAQSPTKNFVCKILVCRPQNLIPVNAN